MNTPQDQEMARRYIPHLIDVKPDIAREYTITDLLHKIDPSASIDPLAESLILDIADDFIDTIVTLSADAAKLNNKQTLTAEDAHYTITSKFGDTSPGSSSYGSRTQRGCIPSENHTKILEMIGKFE
ncbi:transcription initiation factor TFIID subunit A, putative [Trichomonas vaginalis G3]|uniref:Transcription initiation factor TFIID subunit A, putative n=1 Tax=Trichomonas vaginalis (strain ATCC PRA-98 / G3) TaxID=412133 RepID=A2E4T9_TRIV3|nr:TAF12 domain-containing protein [Trichomonas vaginalis G3]EAY12278.1 transcription initiation factor TFIID subunit A, putative [Trichomonas vaginalis G3]KAI5552394.1 TAF12 domain-containing protein [Trichomonas vaginalis G3]|eukprot:XP_001324501.1 transcription initiation factor TFIID subunit A [Trichomonas vaginalis G3]